MPIVVPKVFFKATFGTTIGVFTLFSQLLILSLSLNIREKDMLQNIIGRKREIELIENCLNSNKPELVAVYGRRRIGKTFLVKQLLGDKFSFYMTGVFQCTKAQMLAYFSEQLALYSGETGH